MALKMSKHIHKEGIPIWISLQYAYFILELGRLWFAQDNKQMGQLERQPVQSIIATMCCIPKNARRKDDIAIKNKDNLLSNKMCLSQFSN